MNVVNLRPASLSDVSVITSVMRQSIEGFGPAAYNERQIASALKYICRPDEQLIDDGTYFVATADGVIAGCGGWSRRRKVYSGSLASGEDDALLDPATEAARIRAMFVRPGWEKRGIGRSILQHAEERALDDGFRRFQLVAMHSAGTLYGAAGYRVVCASPITLEDGVVLECTLMEK